MCNANPLERPACYSCGVRTPTSGDAVCYAPATLIREMAEATGDSKIVIGGQNFYWAEEGEFTGELSTALLKQEGARRSHRARETPALDRFSSSQRLPVSVRIYKSASSARNSSLPHRPG